MLGYIAILNVQIDMIITFFTGLSVGFSLIIAIGAQNAFVLKQGLKQQYIFIVCLICALSDAVLIYLGVTGFSHLINQYPFIVSISKYAGALFLIVYGARNFYSAYKNQQGLEESDLDKSNLYAVIATCLAFTWLNPHVYLDTVILMGSISTHFQNDAFIFALGAMSASWIFFFSLGYGAKYLLPLFKQPKAWKILDLAIGLTMWFIAIGLII